MVPLDRERVRGLSRLGGTILGSSRTNPFEGEGGGPEAIKKMMERNEVDALIAVGGEGTLTAARRLSDEGIKIIGVPKTIDNDIDATDYSFGFQTAVEIATEAIDRIRTTAESHERCIVVEVMGREVDCLALRDGGRCARHIDSRTSRWYWPDCRVGQERSPPRARSRVCGLGRLPPRHYDAGTFS